MLGVNICAYTATATYHPLFAFSPKCSFFIKHKKIYLMLYWNLLSCLYLTKPFCLRLRYAFFKQKFTKNLHILLYTFIYTYITKEILKIPTFGNFFPSNFTFGSIGDMQKNNNAVSVDEIFKINSNK